LQSIKHPETYKNEDPSPSWSSTNPIHVLDSGSKQPRKGARELMMNLSVKKLSLNSKISQHTEAAEKKRAILD
jgi:hypothetical protein